MATIVNNVQICYAVDMKFIELTHGFQAIVDDEDYKKLQQYKWYVRKHGHCYYAYGYPKHQKPWSSKMYLMHRIIINAPKGMEVDHIDRDGLNNQRNNLRVCTKSQNIKNARLRSDNTTGYKGVYHLKDRDRYWAYLNIRDDKNKTKRIGFGLYKTAIEAAKARDAAARKYHGEFAFQNFPQKEVA